MRNFQGTLECQPENVSKASQNVSYSVNILQCAVEFKKMNFTPIHFHLPPKQNIHHTSP